MRVLVTGHQGYIGCVLTPMLREAGHDVVGVDSDLFEGCTLGDEPWAPPALRKDVRELTVSDLEGFDAVIHLAGLSNDPLGDLNPDCTYDINHRASVRVAELAKEAGVSRFLHSSSCSLYGAGGQDWLDEDAEFHPVTPYGVSKVWCERDISPLADDSFSPSFLRNATAYGVSPRLRADLVVNNLVGYAMLTGEVLIKSDGTPWRPLVHIEDISRAFLAILEAPREAIHDEAFNVGVTEENYQVKDLAEIVAKTVPGSRVVYAPGGEPDERCYRVNCQKIVDALPAYKPAWTVERGARQLHEAYKACGLTEEDFLGARFLRIRHIRSLLESGRLDTTLRWTGTPEGA